ncbi:MAG: DNA (cytosine-5-)-methyltransferase [Merdibacter sp.]
MAIRFFDMFAGIGGFRSGLERIGGFECIGHCEIDKNADAAYRAMYDTKGECYFADATKIDPALLPDFDLICAGFPCQAFSIAGKRHGFEDARGTLFFEVARIAAARKPAYLLLENVPGLLSHDKGRTFATILSALDGLGYDVTWQVLNSKDFGVPQSRKRVYIIGYLRGKCPGEILSFTNANGATLVQVVPGREGNRIYGADGVSITLTGNAGGFGGKTGLYNVELPIKVKTKSGYQMAHPGDSIDLAYPNQNTRRGRVGKQVAHTVTPGATQGLFFIDMNPNPTVTNIARCITARQDSGISNHRGEHSGVLIEDAPRAVITPDRETVRQQGRRMKEPNEPMFTITAQDKHGVIHHGRVRKLTPRECWRLQGFSDAQFDKVKPLGLADGQLYKMAGNSVSVPVISAIGQKIKEIYEETELKDNAETNDG